MCVHNGSRNLVMTLGDQMALGITATGKIANEVAAFEERQRVFTELGKLWPMYLEP